MLIKYVWHEQPDVVKTHDTELSLFGNRGVLNALDSHPTQEEWDKRELKNFEEKKRKGYVLSYEVVEEA